MRSEFQHPRDREALWLQWLDKDQFQGFAHVAAWLIAGHLDVFGGYPYAYIHSEGLFIVASLDDSKDRNRTELTTYRVHDLRAWEEEATAYRLDRRCDWGEAIGETIPDDARDDSEVTE